MRRCVAAGWRWLAVVALLAVLGWPGTALADPPRPSADPAGASPTAPDPAAPPLGRAPDGSIVGGADLAARGLVLPSDAAPLPPDITAPGWVVADAGTGEVLGARDPHGRYYPASTLKVLTLLSLHPLLDPDEVVTATVEDEQAEGSRVGLIRGGRYDVATLWHALMLQSGNDAANALARAAGGLDPTLAAMYETADRLRAYDTSPGGPSGLDVAGQRSSAYDLALMMTAAAADPDLLAIMATTRAQMPPVPGMDPGFEIQNQNGLLVNYPDAIAGKTGFTDAARHTYVGAAERDGRRLVVSLLRAEQVPIPTWEQAARLLDWAFALPPDIAAVGQLVSPGAAPEHGDPHPAGGGPLGLPLGRPGDSGVAAAGASGALPALALGLGSAAIIAGTAVSAGRTRIPARRAPSGPG